MLSPPITWQWLAGFFQAEGCYAGNRFSVSQARREGLDMIREFLVENVDDLGRASVLRTEEEGPAKDGRRFVLYKLNVHHGRQHIIKELLPYLRGSKRNIFSESLLLNLPKKPINDDWIIGFWEGDGSIHNTSRYIVFTQKDRNVLEEVQSYLKLGSILQKGTMQVLNITTTKASIARIGQLLAIIRTPYRIEQVNKILRS